MARVSVSTCRVGLGRRRLEVEYRLYPARRAPHFGPDHPDYLAPGSPARIEVVRVLEDRVDLTSRFSLPEVERLVCQEIGVAGLERAGGYSFPAGPLSSRKERALAVGEAVLANREWRVRDNRENGRLWE